ncbi:MAG: hypothetical protein GEU26_15165 [Nitrososphaeraceae archaeon]|nr:hypothetical protein [Nitrososphaeraceae archaeon]
MVRIINADPEIGSSMTEDEVKDYMIKRTILHIGIVDNKGESNVAPVGYYFDSDSNKIYITTHKNSKKVRNLSNKKIISFYVDDPNPPYKGVRGKGEVRVHEEINHNRLIAEKLLMRSLGSLEHPTSKWLLGEIEKGNEVVLEVSPLYYSTWDYGKTIQ